MNVFDKDFDLADPNTFAAGFPHGLFAWLRQEAPVFLHPSGSSLDGESFWVLSRHAEILDAASSPLCSAQGGGGRRGGGTHLDDLEIGRHAGVFLPMMDDPRHALFKEMLVPAVGEAQAAQLEMGLRSDAEELIAASVGDDGVDFVTDVAEPYAMRAIGLLLGVPRPDRDWLAGLGSRVVGFAERDSGRITDGSRKTVSHMQHYNRKLLAIKRVSPSCDLTSLLACGELAPSASRLSPYERELNLTLFVLHGGEQPRNTIAAGVLGLAQHPDQWRYLRADRSLIPGAVEEILRWAPPNPYNRRTATADIDIDHTRIAAGDKITLWWPSANRDKAAFDDPDVFDIQRNPNPHMAFGAGRHTCLAVVPARTQIRVLLEVLVEQVAEIRLLEPQLWAPNNKHSVLLRMPVKLVPAASATHTRQAAL